MEKGYGSERCGLGKGLDHKNTNIAQMYNFALRRGEVEALELR